MRGSMKKICITIMLLALVIGNVHCGGGGSASSKNTSLVTITVGDTGQTASVQIQPETFFTKVASFLKNLKQSAALASIPSNVYKIVFMIAGQDMSTITKEVFILGQTQIQESFSVQNGKNRYFLVEAKDISGKVLYRGEATSDLNGKPVHLFITMQALDLTPPSVISTDPAPNNTGVAITSPVLITFSETMDPATFNSATFSVTGAGLSLSGTFSVNGAVATFTPSSPLAYSTLYTATITTGVKDTVGNPLTSDHSWSFTTAAAPDTTPPTITGVSPGIDAAGVAITSTITATFSEAMDPSTITSSAFLLKDKNNNTVTGTVTYTGMTATFTPSAGLEPNMIYTATVTTGVKDLAGNPMASDYSWSFTTADEATKYPVVVSVTPANEETAVAINTVVTATFSKDMDPATLNTSTFILQHDSPTVAGTATYFRKTAITTISGTVSCSGKTATFTPSSNLVPNTTYTAKITTGAMDSEGNPLASDYSWSFTTAISSPVISVTPSTITIQALTNPESSITDNKTFAISGGTPPYTVTSGNVSLIPNPGTLTGSQFTIDPNSVCASTPVTLTVKDVTNATIPVNVTLVPPSIMVSANPANRTICEDNTACTAGTEALLLAFMGVAPFHVVSSNTPVIINSGSIANYFYYIDAIDNSIFEDTTVNIQVVDNCSQSVNTSVLILNQAGTVGIDIEPQNAAIGISPSYPVSADIYNNGSANASNVSVFIESCDFYLACECNPVTITNIPAGSFVTVSVSPFFIPPVSYRIIVDPNFAISESAEGNNCIDNSAGSCSSAWPTECTPYAP
jgi:hypothetical protein